MEEENQWLKNLSSVYDLSIRPAESRESESAKHIQLRIQTQGQGKTEHEVAITEGPTHVYKAQRGRVMDELNKSH